MKNSRGFTLMEVLVALGLLAVAMLAIAPLFSTGLRTNAVGWDFSMLNALAKQRLEEVLQYGFNDSRLAVPNNAMVTIDDPNNPGSTISVVGQLYTNQMALFQTVGGIGPVHYPYKTVYVVQDFRLADIPQSGPPLQANAHDDADTVWSSQRDVKLITVYALSIRVLQGASSSGFTGSPYAVNMFQLTANESPGKQVRMSALKSP